MLGLACDWSVLFPMRNSGRLLMRHTFASNRRTSGSSSGSSSIISASSRDRYSSFRRALLSVAARRPGSRRMERKDGSGFSARENSTDFEAGSRLTAVASPGGAAAEAGGVEAVARGPEVVAGGSEAGEAGVEAEVGSGGATAAAAGAGGAQKQDGERFRVSDSVSLVLHGGDITKWSVDGETDAIVNAANSRMLGGGGVDGAIHRKAGPGLKEACRQFPQVSKGVRCPVGEARMTPAFNLPVARVIHTVGPVYYEYENPADLLGNAYRNSLKAAIDDGINYVCFPAISCGVYSYPVSEAAAVSLAVIKEASKGLSEVHFVMFERDTYEGWMKEASKQFERV